MTCPCCEIEMVIRGGDNICPKCKYREGIRLAQKEADRILEKMPRFAEDPLHSLLLRRAAHSK